MNEQKSIYACYEEIKQREIRELKDAVKAHGGKYKFGANGPVINVNYDCGPEDVTVGCVEIQNLSDTEIVVIYDTVGEQINKDDIAYGHIEFITKSIPSRTFSKESFCISNLSREDLEELGFDTSDVDDATMERIASKLGDDYCEQMFWTSLEIIAEEGFDIPRKEGRDNED